MERSFSMSVPAIAAAVAAAFVLSACDRNDTSRTSSTAPSSTTSSMATNSPAPPAPSSSTMGTTSGTASTSSTAGAAVDDTAITAKVKSALLAEPGLKSLSIDVKTNNSTVTLSGSVDSDASRTKAKQVAQSVSGVSNVVDQLTVKSS